MLRRRLFQIWYVQITTEKGEGRGRTRSERCSARVVVRVPACLIVAAVFDTRGRRTAPIHISTKKEKHQKRSTTHIEKKNNNNNNTTTTNTTQR